MEKLDTHSLRMINFIMKDIVAFYFVNRIGATVSNEKQRKEGWFP